MHPNNLRRRVELHPVCMEDLNEISLDPLKRGWANGEVLLTYIMAAAYAVDQSKQDLLCCESSQKCKTCPCPRYQLHDLPPKLPP